MTHKKHPTSWLPFIIGGACIAGLAWYFFKKERPSTMDTMQHPSIDLVLEEKGTSLPTTSLNVCEVSAPEQLEAITKSTRPTVIKFYAPWCGACNHVASYYTDIAQQCGEKIDFYSVNIDTPGLAEKADALELSKEKIQYLPTFVFYQAGKVREQKVGALSKEQIIETIKTLFPV